MDGQTLFTLIANTGFAIGVATYLVRWVTQQINTKIDRIIELQREIVDTQKRIVDMLEALISKQK